MRFQDQVVIVTGGGQGLGRAFVKAFAGEGARVVIAEKNEAKSASVAGEVAAAWGEALPVKTDVSDAASVDRMVKTTVAKYGRIDVLVNNAGILAAIKMKPFWEISVEEWDEILDVNLRSMFLCSKAVAPIMQKQGRGKIINLSSSTAFEGRPRYLHYVTSKAGVIGLTRAMSRELGAWNINVNAISPGAIETEIPRDSVTPEQLKALYEMRSIKRKGTPQDLTGVAMFLASDEASFISGQVIMVDGGLTMH